MSKKKHPKKPQKAEIQLTPEENAELQMILDRLRVQSPDGESFKTCLQSLRKALATREVFITALLDRLSRDPSMAGFHVFVALQDLVEEKKLQRVVKQAGYRFSQRGYGVPIEEPGAERIILVKEESRESVAHMVPAKDAFWLVSGLIHEPGYPDPVAVSAYVEAGFSGVRVKVADSSHRLYREFIQKMSTHFPDKPVGIPVYHMARLFREMVEFSGEKGLSPEAFRAKRLLQPYSDPQKLPYAYDLMAPVEHPERKLHEVDLKPLLEKMAVQWFLFSREELQPYKQKLDDLEHPMLVIPKEIQQERSKELVIRAGNELCIDRKKFLFQRYLEEQAMWYKLSGEERLALDSWILAQHLSATSEAGENPVVFQLILASLSHYWPEDFKQGDDESGLFHQTDSGLILPR